MSTPDCMASSKRVQRAAQAKCSESLSEQESGAGWSWTARCIEASAKARVKWDTLLCKPEDPAAAAAIEGASRLSPVAQQSAATFETQAGAETAAPPRKRQPNKTVCCQVKN